MGFLGLHLPLLVLFCSVACPGAQAQSGTKRSVCYYTNWAQYRKGIGKFLPENIDVRLCTHIIIAFAKVENNDIVSIEWNDDSNPTMIGMIERARARVIISSNPSAKLLIAVGGWNAENYEFSKTAASAKSRSQFARNAIRYMKERQLDGLDLDWEYPVVRDGTPADKKNFVLLIKALKDAFTKESQKKGTPRLLLTAALGVGMKTIAGAYDIGGIWPSLDFVSLMTYDFHGNWEYKVGHNSPLYNDPFYKGDDKDLNIDAVVTHFLEQGIPPEKMNLGLSAYGRTFILGGSNANIGAHAPRPGFKGEFTATRGFLSYYEVCDQLKKETTTVYDNKHQHVRYATFNKHLWVGYDDPRSIKEKSCYARQKQFGGIMIWAVDLDDFSNYCNTGKYPLLRTAVFDFFTKKNTNCDSAQVDPKSIPIYNVGTGKSEAVDLDDKSPQSDWIGGARGFPTEKKTCNDTRPIPHPTRCSLYIQCVNNVPVSRGCPSALYFNDKTRVCDWPSNVPRCHKSG